ncbi:LamB/YcsF family protein [Marininema halotolerans]|uniref:5-oxoprolinase subunit A n=1 Tax=Marininema halotolerans TaxID=1155944 RepID=A0A1I6TML4_9BACL|nr:5-oxoprolinase subunit PxpA [Marininema halotolerans]SFS90459.1 UPF0271 protein [Marininema halotolerans]
MSRYRIDLNCDMGESFGAYEIGQDRAVLSHITSANIACGYHAGDPNVMRRTVRAALEKGVGLGAHPGLPDLIGFGRRDMAITPEDAYTMTLYQVGALAAIAKAEGGRLQHVKPHGALFNMAAKDAALARGIAQAVASLDESFVLFGLAGSELVKAGREVGLSVAEEVFADRTYQVDGSLTPRSHPHAVIKDPTEAAQRVIQMVTEKQTITVDGAKIPVNADTVCIHGDHPDALTFIEHLLNAFRTEGISVKGVCQP